MLILVGKKSGPNNNKNKGKNKGGGSKGKNRGGNKGKNRGGSKRSFPKIFSGSNGGKKSAFQKFVGTLQHLMEMWNVIKRVSYRIVLSELQRSEVSLFFYSTKKC